MKVVIDWGLQKVIPVVQSAFTHTIVRLAARFRVDEFVYTGEVIRMHTQDIDDTLPSSIGSTVACISSGGFLLVPIS